MRVNKSRLPHQRERDTGTKCDPWGRPSAARFVVLYEGKHEDRDGFRSALSALALPRIVTRPDTVGEDAAAVLPPVRRTGKAAFFACRSCMLSARFSAYAVA